MNSIENLIENTRLNAIGAWILILALSAISVFSYTSGDYVFAGFSAFTIAISLIPVISFRDALALPPWEIILLPVISFIAVLFTPELPLRYFSYLSTAGIAMIVVVELHFFTNLKMNDIFAVILVTFTTVASAGIWALARWFSDLHMGTNFLINHDALMWEFVLAAFSGIVAGIGFDLYFKHFVSSDMYDEVKK